MATILPGSPPTFNRNDVNGTVKALCTYTRNLQENLDFMLGQLKRDVSDAQKAISAHGEDISALRQSLADTKQDVTTLRGQYSALSLRVAALEAKSSTT